MRKFIFNSCSINATVAGGGLLVDASFFDDEEDMETSEDKNASFSSSVFICRFLNDRVKLERMSYPVEGVRMMTSIGLFFFVFSLSVIVDVDVLLL